MAAGLILSQLIRPRLSTVSMILSPRASVVGGDAGHHRAQVADLDRQQPRADRFLQGLVEPGLPDLGEEGRVEVGPDLRVGEGQVGDGGDEPPELSPGRSTGRARGLGRLRREGHGAQRYRRPGGGARASQQRDRDHQRRRTGHAGRPRLVFFRMRSSDILSSAISKYPHRWPSHHRVDGPDTCCDRRRMDDLARPVRAAPGRPADPAAMAASTSRWLGGRQDYVTSARSCSLASRTSL